MVYFSIIIPVYNRPEEIRELLQSLVVQTDKDFEVLIMEDASTLKSDKVVEEFKELLDIKYYFEPGIGRSERRNIGMERAKGEYMVFFDSDCIIPPNYFAIVAALLKDNFTDCYGGPDSAHTSFSDFQKAVNFSMTSFITTGGIRGKQKGMDKFYPRTFNMGFSKEVYKSVGGFKNIFGEDVDISLRIEEAGYKIALYEDAFVYHKRRVTFRSFFKQVKVFGMGRIDLYLLHPASLKLVHYLPAFFTIGVCILILGAFFSKWALLPLLTFIVLILSEALIKTRSLSVAFLAILTSFTQLLGYGFGFLKYYLKKILFKNKISQEKELKKYY